VIHPHTILRVVDEKVGHGLFAARLIPRGTITWVHDALDQVVTPQRLAALPSVLSETFNKYSFRDECGNYVLCWDLAAFMNHSCTPSCAGTDYGFELAIRDILPGEQLTDDYASLNLRPCDSFLCHCGSSDCRGWITSEDAAALSLERKALVRAALGLVTDVGQPLWPLVPQNSLTRACIDHDISHRAATPASLLS
jgi:hypothetical protein